MILAAWNLIFICFECVIFSLHPVNPITPENMNWSPLCLVVVAIFLGFSWIFYGRNNTAAFPQTVGEIVSQDSDIQEVEKSRKNSIVGL